MIPRRDFLICESSSRLGVDGGHETLIGVSQLVNAVLVFVRDIKPPHHAVAGARDAGGCDPSVVQTSMNSSCSSSR